MVYGESGQYPVEIQAKCNMLNFWLKLTREENSSKFSSVMYRFMYELYVKNIYKFAYLTHVENTLNEIGLSGIWIKQGCQQGSCQWFKGKVKLTMRDIFVQNWFAEINTKEIFYTYRLYKDRFACPDYLTLLSSYSAQIFMKFRTLNHRLPVQTGRFCGTPRHERLCTKCNVSDIGDEFHYVV